MMTPAEMKIMSAYQWQNMSLGGLKPHELRGLAFHLSKASAVRRAAAELRLEATPPCAAGCNHACGLSRGSSSPKPNPSPSP